MEESDNYLDAEQDLLGGIESGISRGQSLKEAMISLYNSGYEKQEIEKAAKTYLDLVNKKSSPGVFPNDLERGAEISSKDKNESKEKKPEEIKNKSPSEGVSSTKPSTPQVVSSYGEEKKKDLKKKDKPLEFKKKDYSEKDSSDSRSKAATFLLIAILVLLLMALASVILFKDELVRFINNLFG